MRGPKIDAHIHQRYDAEDLLSALVRNSGSIDSPRSKTPRMRPYLTRHMVSKDRQLSACGLG